MSTPSSKTNNNNNNVTPDARQNPNALPVNFTPASAKKGRFNKVKKATPASQRKAKETVKVVLVKPDAASTISICGIVITPTGFFMDAHLENVFFRRGVPSEVTDKFLVDSGCVHRGFYVLDSDGNTFKKCVKGDFYAVRSAFIPVEDPDDLDNATRVTQLVDNFANCLWSTIDKEKYSTVKVDDLPKIQNYERDVRLVTNYADVMEKQEDTVLIMTMACKKFGMTFFDWIHTEDEDNLYTMFHRGQIDPSTALKWRLPFEAMTQQDQTNYRQFNEENQRRLAAATGAQRSLNNDMMNEDVTLQDDDQE